MPDDFTARVREAAWPVCPGRDDDILEWLSAQHAMVRRVCNQHFPDSAPRHTIYSRAADEIRRLRRDVELLQRRVALHARKKSEGKEVAHG